MGRHNKNLSLIEAYGRFLYGADWARTRQMVTTTSMFLHDLERSLRESGYEIVTTQEAYRRSEEELIKARLLKDKA